MLQSIASERNMVKLSSGERIDSVDILRGIIIVIMGLDHVRDLVAITPFAPEDLTQTTPAWFFTRWITHYCAPIFVFLAGTSAFLYGEKVNNKRSLSGFLIKRAIWLIFIEIFVVNFGWKFHYDWFFMQVIWVTAWSMFMLALLVWVPLWFTAIFSIVLITGHNLLDSVTNDSFVWSVLHVQKFWTIPGTPIGLLIAYPIIPWPGIMAAGYVMGHFLLRPYPIRKKYFTIIGLSLLLIFVVLRFSNVYGDLRSWSVQPRGATYTFLSFLNTTKYPPSLLYLCMTLGPALLVLPYLENLRNKIADFFLTFGKVPFFYYILHVPIIHVIAILIGGFRYGVWKTWLFSEVDQWPAGYQPNLLLAYAVWIFVTILMYYLCRWFASVKKRRKDWWLKYL